MSEQSLKEFKNPLTATHKHGNNYSNGQYATDATIRIQVKRNTNTELKYKSKLN